MSTNPNEFLYEVDLFIEQPDEELICPICLCVMKNPQQLNVCQHMFCRTCISSHLQSTPVANYCPLDRKSVTMANVQPAPRAITNIIKRLQVRCVHYSEGCSEVITLENLEAHGMVCGSCSGRRRDRANPTTETPSGTTGTTINVFVKMVDTGKTALITINSDDTILLLKQRIHEKEGVDQNSLALHFKAKPLIDTKCLSEYGLKNNDRIIATRRFQGGFIY